MADLVEPIPQIAIGDLAAVADRYLASAGDATLLLVSCDNWVEIVRADGFTRFHNFMDRAIHTTVVHVPPKAKVLRLESDQFAIVASGLSNREARALAMRIQVQVTASADKHDTDPVISVAVGNIYPGQAKAIEVITRAKEALGKTHSVGAVLSVSSAPLADPFDDADTKPLPTPMARKQPVQVLPIVHMERHEVVAFELVSTRNAELHDLSTALEIGQSLAGGLNVHVNIPGVWLTSPMIDEVVYRLENGPNTLQICLELSARSFTQEGAMFKRFVNHVRGLGCIIALDDVGFGATTLEQFVDIEPDIVKFAAEVLIGLRGPNRARAARMIDVMAFGEHMLMGQGVENEADEHLLASTGIFLAQGPLYGPPTS